MSRSIVSRMTKVLLVYGHEDSKKSFNAAMKDVAIETLRKKGNEVKVSSLCDMKFQCFSPSDIKGDLDRPDQFNWNHEMAIANVKGTMSDEIKQEQDKVKWADIILYQFPIHALSFPAVVSAWNSKVLTPNFAQSDQNMFDNGLMKGKKVLLSVTCAGCESMFTDRGIFGDINIYLYCMMKPLHFFGFSFFKPQISYDMMAGHDDAGKKNLDQWRQRLCDLDEEETLKNLTLPDSCFGIGSTWTLSDEFVEKSSSDEYGPTIGQHMGKRIPKIL